MGAKGCDKSSPTVLPSLLIAASICVFITSLQLCGLLLSGGVVVRFCRGLYLTVGRGIVESFVILVYRSASNLFVSSSPCFSFDVSLFGALERFVRLLCLRAEFVFVGQSQLRDLLIGLWSFGVSLEFIKEGLKFIVDALFQGSCSSRSRFVLASLSGTTRLLSLFLCYLGLGSTARFCDCVFSVWEVSPILVFVFVLSRFGKYPPSCPPF